MQPSPRTHEHSGPVRTRLLPAFLVLVAAIILGAAAPAERGEVILFDDAKIFVEVNATDGDAGIQVMLDGESWKEVRIVNPKGKKVLTVKTKKELKELGLTELFFESTEPSFDELGVDEFLDLFPEGEYHFFGKTVEGDELVGAAMLTHDIPDGPRVVAPEEGAVMDPDDTLISWEPVTSPPGIEIVGYQVIVEREDPLRAFSVHLPAGATSVTVPPEFLDSGTEHKFEILAIEASGNQTITESFFETE